MNNDRDPDIEADTEARVANALRSLADAHTPTPRNDSKGQYRSHRRTLLAAAAAVLVVGIGALLVVADRDSGDISDRLPQVDTTTPTTTEAAAPPTTPHPGDVFYSATPLADDVVPVLVPPPVEPVFGYEFSSLAQWISGMENATWFAVLDNDRVVGSVYVFDSAAPWAILADGQEVIDLNGRQAIQVDTEGQRGLVVKSGDTTRFALDTSPVTSSYSVDGDTADLLSLIGDGSLNQFDDTARFVRARIDIRSRHGVSYGDDPTVDLAQFRLEPGSPQGTAELIKQLFQFSSLADSPDRLVEVVQVSPVDLVLVGANDSDQLSTAVQSLRMVPLDKSGIDFESFGWGTDNEVIARGEPEWGRWEVAAVPEDASCQFFQVNVWNLDDTALGFDDCGQRNPVRADGGRVYCASLELETVVVVLGARNSPEFALGDDIDGLRAERFESPGAVTVRVVQDDPGANIRAATITVDGVQVNCTN